MRVINRTVSKVLPGKMAEAMDLEKKGMAIWRWLVEPLPPTSRYKLLTGGYDALHTVIVYQEWNSLGAWESAAEKAAASPEMRALGNQWGKVLADYRVEFYTEIL